MVMINISKIFILLIIFLCSYTLNVHASQYNCSVQNVVNTDLPTDKKYIADNFKKKFLISIEKKQIFVTSISKEFKNSQVIYNIINKNSLGIFSISESPIGFRTLIFSVKINEGNIVMQTSVGTTSWQLQCKNEY